MTCATWWKYSDFDSSRNLDTWWWQQETWKHDSDRNNDPDIAPSMSSMESYTPRRVTWLVRDLILSKAQSELLGFPYENTHQLSLLDYKKHKWDICGDLKAPARNAITSSFFFQVNGPVTTEPTTLFVKVASKEQFYSRFKEYFP